jgi:hypothetical protein
MENEGARKRSKRRTPAEIAVILSEYRASKMTGAEFCVSRQLHHPTFNTTGATFVPTPISVINELVQASKNTKEDFLPVIRFVRIVAMQRGPK